MITVGIDPGSSSSPTGIAVLVDGEIVGVAAVKGKAKETLQEVVDKTAAEVYRLVCEAAGENGAYESIQVLCEEVLMFRGPSGPLPLATARFHKFLGALQQYFWYVFGVPTTYLSPTTVKRHIAGDGKAEKEDVANALTKHFKSSESHEFIQNLIEESELDCTDAVAIAKCSAFLEQILREKEEAAVEKKARRKRKMEKKKLIAQQGA